MKKEECFIHPTAAVSKDAVVGKNTKIWQYCNILAGVFVGENCNIGQNVFIENGCKVGNNVKIKNNIAIYTGVTLEDDTFIGPNVVFTNVVNPRSFIERKAEFKSTIVKKGASLGANVTVVCGHTIGEYALIGAGSVVTKDIPPYALAMGNPARVVGHVCYCGEKLSMEKTVQDADVKMAYCPSCNRKYKKENGRIIPQE